MKQFVLLILSALVGVAASAQDLSYKTEAYYPAFCRDKTDIRSAGDPRKALRMKILDLSVRAENISYTLNHLIAQCQKFDGLPMWTIISPLENSALIVSSYRLFGGVANAHFYQDDQFGNSFISQGQMALKDVLSKSKLKKYSRHEAVQFDIEVGVGYNVMTKDDGTLISFKPSSFLMTTGFFVVTVTLQQGQVIDAKVSPKY